MQVIRKIFFIIYYFFLTVFIFLQAIFIDAKVDGQAVFNNRNLEIINIIFYVLLLIIGLMNLGEKHKEWLPKKVILALIISFLTWLLVSYLILNNNGYLKNDYTLVLSLPIFPCLAHNIWYYLNFEKASYSFKQIDNKVLTSYSQIFDLNLPYLKTIENRADFMKIVLSVPYSVSKLFGVIFILLWFCGWTFGATTLFLNYPLAVLFYIPSIFALYILISLFFTKIYLTITSSGIQLKRMPFKKIINFNNLNDLELRESCSSRGGCIYYLININNGNTISLRNKEMIFIVLKILEIHLFLKNTKS